MKCLKYFLCIALLASCLLSVPVGCSSNEATKIDASEYVADEEGEEDEEDISEED